MLVPSPKVATYDLQPEMSAAGVTDELVRAIESDAYDFIVANYANPDMVGHTGVWERDHHSVRVRRRLAWRRRVAVDASLGGGRGCCASRRTTATPTRCATKLACP